MADTDTDIATSPPDSTLASPQQRPGSPSPSTSPSRALGAIPLLDRSVSTASTSTGSSLSTRSASSRTPSDGSTVVRRRGYMRPQGTAFADSARNRDSVMSLGSIAHMQYYFARTGLLDGKGAQLAKTREKEIKAMSGDGTDNQNPYIVGSGDDCGLGMSSLSLHDGNSAYAVSEVGDHCVMESPTDMQDPSDPWTTGQGPVMLPPTVSTYKQKPQYIPSPPEMPVLRRELRESLDSSRHVLEEVERMQKDTDAAESSGFHEIQGLHLLDIITLAIRAAKNYYTAHAHPQKLYAIKSEKQIRSDLYQCLDVLKRMASRNFRGGIKSMERAAIQDWITSIDALLTTEEEREQAETAERDSWTWRQGEWAGRERERERLFLASFDPDTERPLPEWLEQPSDPPSLFLAALQDGQRLISLHNALLQRSRRCYGKIDHYHTDVAKPYRRAENLRYWIKAAELRWEVKLNVNALDVAQGKDEATWEGFDGAVLKWCRGVREELVEEWRQDELRRMVKPPELRHGIVDVEASGVAF